MKLFKADTFNQALCLNYSQKILTGLLHLRGVTNAGEANNASEQAQCNSLDFKYNAVFNSANSCRIIMDKHLNLVDFNYASFLLFKKVFNKRIAVGKHIASYITEDRLESVLENCMRALSGDTFAVERQVTFTDGSSAWWQIYYSPAYNNRQHIAGVVYSASDITERKALEAEIEEQHLKLRTIALVHSHDVRSPLCTLMGLVDLLKTEGPEAGARLMPMIDDTIALLDNNIRGIVKRASGE